MKSRGRPKKGHQRLTVHFPKQVIEAIRQEARDREITMSELLLEAYLTRTILIRRAE